MVISLKLNKGIKFTIGLLMDIGISLVLGLNPLLTTLFALLYITLYIPDICNIIKK